MNNRQIKFRVVDPNLGEVFGYERFSPTNGWTHCLTWETQDSQTWRPGIISEKMDSQFNRLQFTGLKDKEGQGVYEWDILTTERYPHIYDGKQNYVSVVEWCFAGFHTILQCVNPDKRGISTGIIYRLENASNFAIIGSKITTPNLLED